LQPPMSSSWPTHLPGSWPMEEPAAVGPVLDRMGAARESAAGGEGARARPLLSAPASLVAFAAAATLVWFARGPLPDHSAVRRTNTWPQAAGRGELRGRGLQAEPYFELDRSRVPFRLVPRTHSTTPSPSLSARTTSEPKVSPLPKLQKPYYSWMWADTATNPAPLDLGHGSIEQQEITWSPWLSCEDAVKDLELYRTADNLKRPVDMRIAAGVTADGGKGADGVQLDNKRFLSKFDNIPQTIEYLNREARREARHAETADYFGTKSTASTHASTQAPTATTTWHMPRVAHAAAMQERARPPSQPQPPARATPAAKTGRERLETSARHAAPASEASAANGSHLPIPTVLGYMGYLGFLPCFACVGYLSYRVVKRRGSCNPSDHMSADEEESSGAEETLDPVQPNTWRAFAGSSHDGEIRRVLFYAEQQGPTDADGASQPVASADGPTAEAEVERILAISSPGDLFGSGGPNEKKREYLRLVRLLHPDKGLAAGERAHLALRRVVEAYRSLGLNA